MILADQIIRAAKFDKGKSYEGYSNHLWPPTITFGPQDIWRAGASWQHDQTIPLIVLLAECAETLEFYASALDTSKEVFGEPNVDPHLMPTKLGTRAKEQLAKLQAYIGAE